MANGTMELKRFFASPRVRTQYLKALAILSDQLTEKWKQVFPSNARWPRDEPEAFFPPFAQFAVAMYNAYAQDLLKDSLTLEQYHHALNFDLKTLVCNQIYPYRAKPIRTLQDAIDADSRGEPLDEWEVRMGESWRLCEHQHHGAANQKVRREFIDLYDYRPDLWEQLIGQIHNAISRRTLSWLAEHAERAEAANAVDAAIPKTASSGVPKVEGQVPSSASTATQLSPRRVVGDEAERREHMESFAGRLRSAREKAKLSRPKAALRLKSSGIQITADAIKKHEEGKAKPKAAVRRAYALIYKTPEDSLFPEEEIPR